MGGVADFSIDMEGLDDYERRLTSFVIQMLDLRPFWPKLVPLFIGWMGKQFETEGAFGGAKWAELSPAYAARKSVLYPGKGILYAEGAMRGAASNPAREVTSGSLTLTITDPKAGYHQTGTTRMPARPLIFETVPASAEAEIDRAAEDYVEGVARSLGFIT